MSKDALGLAPTRDYLINYDRKKFIVQTLGAYTKNVLQS
jgi:hypothetical protein